MFECYIYIIPEHYPKVKRGVIHSYITLSSKELVFVCV